MVRFLPLLYFGMAVLMTVSSCSFMNKQRRSPITVYHVFDSLESYLCKIVSQQKHLAIVIHPNYSVEARNMIPELENPAYLISIYKSHQEIGYKKYDSIMSGTNRYMEICEHLYPVIIMDIDEDFTSPMDSTHLSFYTKYGRHLVPAGDPSVIVDLDKGIFYDYYNPQKPRGHLENLSKRNKP